MAASGMASVIIPTANRYHVAKENIENCLKQTYTPLEVIVCDDSNLPYHKEHSPAFIEWVGQHPNVKYLYCARFDANGNKDYGLARARNFGVIESSGPYTILLDDRITPANEHMVAKFVSKLNEFGRDRKVWIFGDKGAHKESFVENCSAIWRHHLVDAGLFLERIEKYGAMSKELFGRFTRQGFTFVFYPDAQAKQVCKSSGWDRKEKEIEESKKFLEKLFAR